MDLHRYTEALIDLDAALRWGINSPDLHQRRGYTLAVLDRLEESAEALTAAIELDPRDVKSLIMRAYVGRKLGDLDRALDDADQAQALGAPAATCCWLRGDIYVEQGDYEAGVAELDTVIEQKPEDFEALNRRAHAWRMLRDREKSDADRVKAKQLARARAALKEASAPDNQDPPDASTVAKDFEELETTLPKGLPEGAGNGQVVDEPAVDGGGETESPDE